MASTRETDDLLSRVSSLEINGESGKGVAYTYVGLARYVKIAYDEPDVDLTYIKEAGSPVGDAGDPYAGYDRFGRTVEMRWQTTGATPELRDGYQWGYDRSSNRTWRENMPEAADELDEHYGYDALNQVTDYTKGNLNINRSAIGGIPGEEQTFTYDPTGNWDRYTTSEDGTETLDQTRVHNQDNQLTQIDGANTGILYDKAGNALKTPPDKTGDWSKYYELTWDGWNRLVEIADKDGGNVATYQYDGRTRRTTKAADGTTTHFYYNDQWRPVEEREDSSTSASRQYLWGVRPGHRDELILRDRDTDGNGSLDERLYCLMDYYNPTSVVNTSGVVQERYGFTAFGLRTIMDEDWVEQSSSAYAFDFGFHGQFLDEESGYYDYGYRYYVPQLGRWINRDPIGEQGGNNLYAFVGNSPQNGNDRYGLARYSSWEEAASSSASNTAAETSFSVAAGQLELRPYVESGSRGVVSTENGVYYPALNGTTILYGREFSELIFCCYNKITETQEYWTSGALPGGLPTPIQLRTGDLGIGLDSDSLDLTLAILGITAKAKEEGFECTSVAVMHSQNISVPLFNGHPYNHNPLTLSGPDINFAYNTGLGICASGSGSDYICFFPYDADTPSVDECCRPIG